MLSFSRYIQSTLLVIVRCIHQQRKWAPQKDKMIGQAHANTYVQSPVQPKHPSQPKRLSQQPKNRHSTERRVQRRVSNTMVSVGTYLPKAEQRRVLFLSEKQNVHLNSPSVEFKGKLFDTTKIQMVNNVRWSGIEIKSKAFLKQMKEKKQSKYQTLSLDMWMYILFKN